MSPNFGVMWDQFPLVILRIAVIISACWFCVVLGQRVVRMLRQRIASHLEDREALQRAETLGRAFRYLRAVAVSAVGGMLVLSELGIRLAPLLGAAGVAGLAVGFGAQSLVKDYFAGFFLLLENQIRVGDVVKVGEHAGLVEEITLRYLRLRDYDGHVHFVPNGSVDSVINMSLGYAHAVVDVNVGYDSNLDEVMSIMADVGQEMRTDPAFAPRISDDLEMAGVEKMSDSIVTLRARLKVRPLEQWSVRREHLRRLKLAFENADIDIPPPQLAIRRRGIRR